MIFLPEFDIYENWIPKFQLSLDIITFKSEHLRAIQNSNHFHMLDLLFSLMAMKCKVGVVTFNTIPLRQFIVDFQ